ncbi:hypothetical protein NDU88_004544, partial [Pleurodeles waltl]
MFLSSHRVKSRFRSEEQERQETSKDDRCTLQLPLLLPVLIRTARSFHNMVCMVLHLEG